VDARVLDAGGSEKQPHAALLTSPFIGDATRPQSRLARHHDADDHDDDGDERERPHRLVPAQAHWKDDRQDNGAENEPVDDAVQGEGEPVPHVSIPITRARQLAYAMLRPVRLPVRTLRGPEVLASFPNTRAAGGVLPRLMLAALRRRRHSRGVEGEDVPQQEDAGCRGPVVVGSTSEAESLV